MIQKFVDVHVFADSALSKPYLQQASVKEGVGSAG
jgi:hypothetical protein